jgi:glycosyltransferase involved in cell wall biosynthesis
MKIAIVMTRTLSKDSGADIRNYYLSKILSKNFDVTVFTPIFKNSLLIDKEGNTSNGKKILLLLQGKIPYIERLKLAYFDKAKIEKLNAADVIQLEEMSSYYVIEKYLKNTKAKIILDTHNIDYQRFLAETDNKGFMEKILGKILSLKIKQMEINAVKKANRVLVCSDKEKMYFSKYTDSKKIVIIPNGVDYKSFKKVKHSSKDIILFMGLLSYSPNAEGLKYYLDYIHPKVIKKIPNVKLMILGKGAPEWLVELSKRDKSIHLVGFVDDVKKYIAQTKVCICPLLHGSGTRLKILEYMAMEKTVVSTQKGAEGLHVKNGFNIFLEDDPEQFANRLIQLLFDKSLRENVGIEARKLISKTYDWDIIDVNVTNLYKTI